MKLQTEVEIAKPDFRINFSDRGLIVGSCFADNVGNMLAELHFNVSPNPYGVMYNPISVANTVVNIKTCHRYEEKELVECDGLWHSFDHHGCFSDPNKENVLSSINCDLNNSFDYLVITLGTAWTFQFNGRTVANCHKLPSKMFTRQRLSIDEATTQLERIVEAYPLTKIIFTVSPIRHVKDGLAENSLSKSILRCAVANVCDKQPNCYYFPAFEIVNDQLRDYRFYKEDMIHPSQTAVEYILERFEETFFDDPTIEYAKTIRKINNAQSHKPLHPNSETFTKFKVYKDNLISEAKKKYPHLNQADLFTKL